MQTPEGAVAFVRFYFDQANKAWMEPSSADLRVLADATCATCANNIKTADDLVAAGQRFDGPSVSVTSARAVDGAPVGQQFVDIELQQLTVHLVDSAGATIKTSDAGSFGLRVVTIWTEGRWLVYGIAQA